MECLGSSEMSFSGYAPLLSVTQLKQQHSQML